MHTKNHRHLGERLPRAASEKRLGLFDARLVSLNMSFFVIPTSLDARLNKPEATL